MISKVNSHSPSDTFVLGREIGSRLKGDEIILLSGELGAGKTLMAKGIASSLGIDPDEIVSPTFTLMNQYDFVLKTKGKPEGAPGKLIHFDCYRLGLDADHLSGGLVLPEIDEWIDNAIILVEWAQYLHPSYFSHPKSLAVRIEIHSHRKRLIRMETPLKGFEITIPGSDQ